MDSPFSNHTQTHFTLKHSHLSLVVDQSSSAGRRRSVITRSSSIHWSALVIFYSFVDQQVSAATHRHTSRLNTFACHSSSISHLPPVVVDQSSLVRLLLTGHCSSSSTRSLISKSSVAIRLPTALPPTHQSSQSYQVWTKKSDVVL
ncbi:hypothetical protein Q3G72_034333 [Acer saccharum]|nr:hypothetical protein Q3G72_034333 [Acer saccharum]